MNENKRTQLLYGIGTLLLLACTGCYFSVYAQQEDRGMSASKNSSFGQDNYHLVWSDEFNVDGAPDSTKWNFESGFERNEEHQWYQSENAWCKDGLLIIEARKERKNNPTFNVNGEYWGQKRKYIEFTSSALRTKGLHQWKYGRFVLRGKIDIDAGMWPAWWTLGINGTWPATGEIDIMEYYRRQVLANAVYLGENKKDTWFTTKVPVDSLGGQKWAAQFHVWRMDWDEEEISIFLDDVLINKVNISKLKNHDAKGLNPFHQPHYMLINLAIGGNQGGDPFHTIFPKRFEVDYVRVYQKK